MIISIHAPPRGATLGIPTVPCIRLISIHAPPRGATSLNMRRNNTDGYFNSRPSARGDVGKVLSGVQSIISIHAPPRGATSTPRSFLRFAYYFNSRPSARGDTRHPDSSVHPPYFNSRPSARGDCGAKFEKIQFRSISIHAPPRGATESCR